MKRVQSDDPFRAKKSEAVMHQIVNRPGHTDFFSDAQIKNDIFVRVRGRRKVAAIGRKSQSHHVGMREQEQDSIETGEHVEGRLETVEFFAVN